MEIEPAWLIGVVVLTVLTVLLTGPGLWSEKWGWKTFERIFSRSGKGKGGGTKG
jgi:hypothetical protein